MHRRLLGFCAGALILAVPWPVSADLPGRLQLVSALLAAAGLLCCLAPRPATGWRTAGGWIAAVSLGLLWSAAAHQRAMDARLPHPASPLETRVVARILGAPSLSPTPPDEAAARAPDVAVARFEIHVVDASAPASPLRGRLRLSWYDPPPLRGGELWALDVVLKAPWSFANPTGFDYERWLLGEGIPATGWVRDGARLAAGRPGPLARLRQRLASALAATGSTHEGVLRALLLGQPEGIGTGLWDLLRATGTVHLVVISGLHVSLTAALGFALGRMLCRLCPGLPLWCDARQAGCFGGAAAALAYVAVAGAGLPALRALAMAGITLSLLAGGRRSRNGAVLLLTLTGCLLVEPLAIHQQGFWLSFGAVALLLLRTPAFPVTSRDGRMGDLWRMQLALSLGLLPLVVLMTGTVPVAGVPANLLAVPVMSLVTVPATLLGALLTLFSPAAGAACWWLADTSFDLLLKWLDRLGAWPAPLLAQGLATLLLAQAAAVGWLLGAPRAHLPILALCCTLPLVPRGTGVGTGSFRVTALDVGQGTAVLVDTRRHRLLYDTGPAFPGGFDAGRSVVVPNVAATGPARLDALVLSHGDLDHVGGAESVVRAFAPGVRFATSASGTEQACHGHRWRWDGVDFRLLAVRRPESASENDRSCVLLVDDGSARMLIAGDVSARVEADLLRRIPDPGRGVDLLFAPHHGSRTSSSRAMVRVLKPRQVWVSAGRANRFGHPHRDTVARYDEVRAVMHQTGRAGALTWHSAAPEKVDHWRAHAPYWRRESVASSR